MKKFLKAYALASLLAGALFVPAAFAADIAPVDYNGDRVITPVSTTSPNPDVFVDEGGEWGCDAYKAMTTGEGPALPHGCPNQ